LQGGWLAEEVAEEEQPAEKAAEEDALVCCKGRGLEGNLLGNVLGRALKAERFGVAASGEALQGVARKIA
jgi:hypothetical protein